MAKGEIDTGGLQFLNLALAGCRNLYTGSLEFVEEIGFYWSSSEFRKNGRSLEFGPDDPWEFSSDDAWVCSSDRAERFSVRLIKD